MVVAGILEHIGNVVVCLAGNPNTIVLEDVGAHLFTLPLGSSDHISDNKRQPLSTGLEQPKTELRELVQRAAHHQGVKRANHDRPEAPEAPAHTHTLVEQLT